MSNISIEMLTPQRVVELWPVLEPYFEAACKGNEVAATELTAKDIYILAATGMAVVFVGFEDGKPACILVLQFNDTNGHKCADVVALAGKNLIKFKAAYWNIILEWLKANKVEFLDAYVSNRFAKILMKRFGFNKSCTYVRMVLEKSYEQRC